MQLAPEDMTLTFMFMKAEAKLTSMCDDTQVRFDHLHVYSVLLISNDHRPPETPRAVTLL